LSLKPNQNVSATPLTTPSSDRTTMSLSLKSFIASATAARRCILGNPVVAECRVKAPRVLTDGSYPPILPQMPVSGRMRASGIARQARRWPHLIDTRDAIVADWCNGVVLGHRPFGAALIFPTRKGTRFQLLVGRRPFGFARHVSHIALSPSQCRLKLK